jgi:hypothetical protein
MIPDVSLYPGLKRGLTRFLAISAIAAIVYTQAPLYYSNQNQYFLHGLAWAGEGLLREDWLAGTPDPTPVFSALVAFTTRYLHPWLFHVYYSLLIGAYVMAMLAIFASLVGEEVARRRWPIFLAGLLLVHSALLRWASYRWLGLDYPWYFQAGVAGQYILGAALQPSVFGVLLVVAIAFIVRGAALPAVMCIGMAATVHSTYLLAGGLLTAGFLAVLAGRGEYRRAAMFAALALVSVLPMTAYVLRTFAPTRVQAFRDAQHILVTFRIPHHCLPRLWFDPIAGLQIGWILVAVVGASRTALGVVLAVPFTLSALLTVEQVLTGNETLALLFPWRISAVLVPVATTVVLARLVEYLPLDAQSTWVRSALATATAALAVTGLWIMLTYQGYQSNDNELRVLDFVRRSKAPGEVYFIPVMVPKLSQTTRGSLSSDFKPLPGKRQDERLIPVDLQRFRLPTGAPLYVDFKSIPYLDIDVLEWRQRIDQAEQIQKDLRTRHAEAALALLREEGVTHLVWPAGEIVGPGFEMVYEDESYRVYRLPPP